MKLLINTHIWLFLFMTTSIIYAHTNMEVAQSTITENKEKIVVEELKVLSWNIYMLPKFTNLSKQINRSYKKKRAKAIAQAVKNEGYHIIVWQETFHAPGRRALKKAFKKLYPYQYGPANKKFLSLKTSSGISIFSKTPLTHVNEIDFEGCIGIDCWARKGCLMMEGELNGKKFQVLGTHLQADGGDSLRIEQVKAIKNQLLLPYAQQGIPQIICGDMNIKQHSEAYQQMLQIYGVNGYDLVGELQQTTQKKGNVIDYIFIKSNEANISSVVRRALRPTQTWGKNGEDWLSDHNAVEAIIRY